MAGCKREYPDFNFKKKNGDKTPGLSLSPCALFPSSPAGIKIRAANAKRSRHTGSTGN